MTYALPVSNMQNSRMVVVIATHNRPNLVFNTIKSILSAQIPKSLSFICIVENGPASGVRELVYSMRKTTPCRLDYRYTPTPNKSSALNIAIESLSDEIVVFFDDDVRISEYCLLRYEEAFLNSGGSKFFGGPFQCDYDKVPPSWLLPHLPKSARGWDPSLGENRVYPDMPFIGFNWAACAKDIKSIGGFNKDYGPGSTTGGTGQEYMAQKTLMEKGIEPQLVPEALVYHFVPATRSSPGWCLSREIKRGITDGYSLQTMSHIGKDWYAIARSAAFILMLSVSLPFYCLSHPELKKIFPHFKRLAWNYGVLVGAFRRLNGA